MKWCLLRSGPTKGDLKIEQNGSDQNHAMEGTGNTPSNFRSPPHTGAGRLPHSKAWHRGQDERRLGQQGGMNLIELLGAGKALAKEACHFMPTPRDSMAGRKSVNRSHFAY
ncbi:protein of unknown function [Nitrospira japonica]|uniref:Uncharacterized protein n=1 Tax=Nitrospira japonica TaxID=1325564 RepID=A0A1W1IAV6_9BACT|nr:protein of unknown function [Nitrospira japonica]